MKKESTFRLLSEDNWMEEYKPIKNTFPDCNGSFDGTMFETYGEELEYVSKQNPNCIWTYLTGDGDCIVNGFHIVNRCGYFITEKEFNPKLEIVIQIDTL